MWNAASVRAFLKIRDTHTESRREGSLFMLFPLFTVTAFSLWVQGPPFQTDDPAPVDLRHYEFCSQQAKPHCAGRRM